MIAPDIEIVATKDFNMKEFENDLETKIRDAIQLRRIWLENQLEKPLEFLA